MTENEVLRLPDCQK